MPIPEIPKLGQASQEVLATGLPTAESEKIQPDELTELGGQSAAATFPSLKIYEEWLSRVDDN